jgi:aspartyl aminopeptidase
MINTQPYGGGLWHTWFDRDLGIAGRAIIRNEDGSFQSKLVRINSPIARIPNLAIHLTAGSEREHFAPNLQDHCKAILTMDTNIVALKTKSYSHFHPYITSIISEQLEVPEFAIVDLELQLIDNQASVLGGNSLSEFIISGRLDNLCSAYQSMKALIDTTIECEKSGKALKNICMCMLFDNEEIGSTSAAGAGSSLFMDTLKLINQALADGTHGMMKHFKIHH